MDDVCEKAGAFVQGIFDDSNLQLRVTVKADAAECVLDIAGGDADLLQAEGGELLEAVQHLATQVFGRQLPKGQRLLCDVNSFRATREAELRAMANHAAQRVRATGTEFLFGPMNANERRIIHVTLADNEDLHTESIGEGSERKLRVSLKK
jgi:spoIIIJ-associated protein